jgi:hypothetical protein
VTLVVSLITPDFVCQASDRRVTDVKTGRQITTKVNKTVAVVPMRLLVSYTGLAQLDGMDTDEWLVRTVYDLRDSDDFFGGLAARAAKAVEKISLCAKDKRHLFVLSGWFTEDMAVDGIPPEAGYSRPPDGGTTAYCCVVTNYLSDAGQWLGTARPEFIHRMRLLPLSEPFHVIPAGALLTPNELRGLDADLASAFRSRKAQERAAAALLIRTIQTVEARDTSVGGGVFVSSLARDFVPPATESDETGLHVMGMKWGLPEAGQATFVHIPEGPREETVESPFIMDLKMAGKMTKLRVRRQTHARRSRASAGGR